MYWLWRAILPTGSQFARLRVGQQLFHGLDLGLFLGSRFEIAIVEIGFHTLASHQLFPKDEQL